MMNGDAFAYLVWRLLWRLRGLSTVSGEVAGEIKKKKKIFGGGESVACFITY